jgi:hypothetical protein
MWVPAWVPFWSAALWYLGGRFAGKPRKCHKALMQFLTLRKTFSLLFTAVLLTAAVHAQSSSGSGTAPDADHPKSSTASDQNRVVLKVGGVSVTEAEFESSVQEFEGQGGEGEGEGEGGGEKVEKTRRDLGDDYASVLMLSQQAVATHLDQTPQVHHDLDIARLQVLSDAEFASLMEQTKPTPQELQQYYQAHKDEYDIVYVRRLFIWKKGPGSPNSMGLDPQEAKATADNIIQAYKTGGDPQKLTEPFQNSPNGLLDKKPSMFTRHELPPALENVAFEMKPGEWKVVQEKPDSILIYQLVEHRPRQLSEVSAFVEKEVQAEKMQAKLSDLRKNAGIWMDKDYFGDGTAPPNSAKRPITSAHPKPATDNHQ